LLCSILSSSLQGLILSNALRAQKSTEDEGCTIALSNLRSEVIELRNEGLEKDRILISLVNIIKEDEAKYNVQAEAQKVEVEDLRRYLAEANENYALAQANREISEYWKNRLEKNVEELRESKEKCFEKSLDCVKKLKTSLSKVGAYSSEENFIRGNPEGVIEWISGEAEAFEEILNDRGDICAFSGAWGISAILEKAGCDHVKAIVQAKAAFSLDDTKDPSAEATLVGGKFYSDVWVNGGRELANEIIKKNEKDTHDAWEEAKQAEEAAEPERHIGIVFYFLASILAFWLRINNLPTTAELSPPLESYNPLADPERKEALNIISMANSIIDEVVDKLLNEVAEKVLREE
jgi:hypothetical protein